MKPVSFVDASCVALIFAVGAFLGGVVVGGRDLAPSRQTPAEIVCDHPAWEDHGFAAVAAQCGDVRVVVLD
jgi:hypothetical protein